MLFPEFVFIAAGILFLLAVARMRTDESPTGKSCQPLPAGSEVSAEHAAKLQASLAELLHELQTLSQDVTGDLEQKLSELKELLQVADRKLEELSSQEQEQEGYYLEKLRAEKERTARPELQITVEDADVPPLSERYKRIYRMADEGLSIDDIARRLEMGKGEIQLILSLRKKE